MILRDATVIQEFVDDSDRHLPQAEVDGPTMGTARRSNDTGMFTKGLGVLQLCNDPSAGSPTETLLRLLLPLNDRVWITSVAPEQPLPASLGPSESLTEPFNR